MLFLKPEHCLWALEDIEARIEMKCVSILSNEYKDAKHNSSLEIHKNVEPQFAHLIVIEE